MLLMRDVKVRSPSIVMRCGYNSSWKTVLIVYRETFRLLYNMYYTSILFHKIHSSVSQTTEDPPTPQPALTMDLSGVKYKPVEQRISIECDVDTDDHVVAKPQNNGKGEIEILFKIFYTFITSTQT